MSSVKEDDGSGEVDGSEKADSALVIAGGEGAVLLELGEEVFNQMPRFIELLIIGPGVAPVRFRRDDNRHARLFEHGEHPLLGILGFIREHGVNLGHERRQEGSSPVEIRSLPGRQMKAGRIAQRIAGRMDFRAHPAFGAANTFRRWVPPFAPAAC